MTSPQPNSKSGSSDIYDLLKISPSYSSDLRLRYLSLLSHLTGQDIPSEIHLFEFHDSISGRLNVWCPVFSQIPSCTDQRGVICFKDLKTPLGTVPRARVRQSDVVAVQFDLKHFA